MAFYRQFCESMTSKLLWLLLVNIWFHGAKGLLCFNCTSAHLDSFNNCGGDFEPSGSAFNNSRVFLVNCTREGAMCFVRSWAARGRFAWLVQRGCYQANKEDILPRTMNIPTRSMSCRHERLSDAEYKVCFCQADWCNSTSNYQIKICLSNIFITILCFVINY